MKKALAVIGIVIFSLMLISLPYSAQQNPAARVDYAYFIGQLVGIVLIIAGLFYSVRWYLKLGGHSYKLARQAWASILFAYSLVGALIGVGLTRVGGLFGMSPSLFGPQLR
jgi:hypothetical protein